MGILEIVLGIIIILMAVVLIALVLLQSGKDKRLSGTIAGAAETFFAKGKSKTRDKMLAKITTAMSFVFVILVVVLYIAVA
jgi:preprotein translocase subunit SecG